MPRPGFEPGTLDYMTSALPTELSGLPSKQSNNLTHSPSLSIERRGYIHTTSMRTLYNGLPMRQVFPLKSGKSMPTNFYRGQFVIKYHN